MREENVVDRVFSAVERGFGIQKTFFTQRVSKTLHGGWGADFMFSQKIASCNLYDCAFFGNSDEESPLFFCQHLAILEINSLPLLHQLGTGVFHIGKSNIGSTVVINGVTKLLGVKGMPAGPFKNKICGFGLNGSILLVEKIDNERFVFFNRNLIKGDKGGAGVKRFACVGKNVGHNVLFTAAKDKRDVFGLLYVGAQQRLHILFRIFTDLLKLVNSQHDGCILVVQKLEQATQGVLFFVGGLVGNLQLRLAGDGVERNLRTECFDECHEFVHEGAFGPKSPHSRFCHHLDEIVQALGGENIHIDGLDIRM